MKRVAFIVFAFLGLMANSSIVLAEILNPVSLNIAISFPEAKTDDEQKMYDIIKNKINHVAINLIALDESNQENHSGKVEYLDFEIGALVGNSLELEIKALKIGRYHVQAVIRSGKQSMYELEKSPILNVGSGDNRISVAAKLSEYVHLSLHIKNLPGFFRYPQNSQLSKKGLNNSFNFRHSAVPITDASCDWKEEESGRPFRNNDLCVPEIWIKVLPAIEPIDMVIIDADGLITR